MAGVQQLVTTYSGGEYNCPICTKAIEIQVFVEVEVSPVRTAGQEGFNKPIFSTGADIKVVGASVDHHCKIGDQS
jgi:hypothetical protein